MVVNGVTSRLETGLDVGAVPCDRRNDGAVRVEANGSLVAPTHFSDNAHHRSDMENSISLKTNVIVMLELALYLAKYLACFSLIAYAGFPADAAINPKGDIRVEVKVPRELELGSYADLKCEWKVVGGEKLYSVKWYKDDHEFFRYLPTNREPIQTFPQQGVQLDERAISEKSIRLARLTLNSTGQYKCEVSTEGPSFATEYKTGNLTVIALPTRGPEITGLVSHYDVGENVTANCSAEPSVPKAKLHWTINGKPIPSEYVVVHPPAQSSDKLGTASSLGLRMDVDPRHFEGDDGVVTIRCISYVGTRRNETKKVVHMAHVNNQRLSAGDLRGGGTSVKMIRSWSQNWLSLVLAALSFFVAT